ncbi:GNAT family N-acetyltransferase [Phycicoccus sonneratiae]|uniref:GNAT family N-acetyltransferase n=1 Tax=Phycicoccus sonneratiae TaxID=2807628 RepID=A0ABS2CHB4_9MICO|nr:GNAT family N-acetyltransferase [Phycicoccus sonneraticus]MBM6399195.1 GNAT family N-acetyltransferase [Phycicoccus sonneraticus]
MPQPVLTTDRLRLEPLTDDHVELEVALDGDAEVLRYLWGRARTREEVVASHAERMAHAARVDGLGFWMAFDGGGPVGLMMLPPAHGPDQPDDPTVCDLGYRLFRRRWGHGYATEASRALLDHAFGTVGQRLVIAQTMAVNRPSRAVMERLRMRHVRTWHGSWAEPVPGAEQGEVEYAITPEEWASRSRRVRLTG